MAVGIRELLSKDGFGSMGFGQEIRDLAEGLCIDFEEGEITFTEFKKGLMTEMDAIRMQLGGLDKVASDQLLRIAAVKTLAVLTSYPTFYSDVERGLSLQRKAHEC